MHFYGPYYEDTTLFVKKDHASEVDVYECCVSLCSSRTPALTSPIEYQRNHVGAGGGVCVPSVGAPAGGSGGPGVVPGGVVPQGGSIPVPQGGSRSRPSRIPQPSRLPQPLRHQPGGPDPEGPNKMSGKISPL